MDLSWDNARLFLAVAETGSLSQAARLLRTTQPTVSRQLLLLEQAVGTQLFTRGVGGATLTSAGERLLQPAKHMAEWAGEFGRAVQGTRTKPEGTVRVTAPPGVAYNFLAPFAAFAWQRYPAIRLEVVSAIHYLDLVRGEADLALRTQAPTQRDLVILKTVTHHNAVYVASAYRRRLPKKPTLAELRWIVWAPPYEALPPNPQLAQLIPNFVPTFAADSYLVHQRAAEAGVGAIIAAQPHHRFVAKTNLVALPINLGPYAQSQLHLVCAKRATDSPRVRAIAELLQQELASEG